MADKQPAADKWQLYEATVDVANDAATITCMISLVGDGRIWLDNVSLEIITPAEAQKSP